MLTPLSDLCVDGEVRIVGGATFGRVDICVQQTWGTVCDTEWNDVVASVICGQQGHSQYGIIYTSIYVCRSTHLLPYVHLLPFHILTAI